MVEQFADHANLKNDPEITSTLNKDKNGKFISSVIGFREDCFLVQVD